LPSKTELLRLHRTGLTMADLSRRFGCSPQYVSQVMGKALFWSLRKGKPKLTERQVREMRRLRGKGWSYPRLEERYGVSSTALRNAIKGHSFSYVDEPLPGPVRTRTAMFKLTEAKVREARRLRLKGWVYSRIGERFGVSRVCVYLAITGKTWAHVENPGPVVDGE